MKVQIHKIIARGRQTYDDAEPMIIDVMLPSSACYYNVDIRPHELALYRAAVVETRLRLEYPAAQVIVNLRNSTEIGGVVIGEVDAPTADRIADLINATYAKGFFWDKDR